MNKICNYFDFAIEEIQRTYGHRVTIGRQALHKFGRNESAGTSEVDIISFGGDPVRSTTNSIDSFSSSNAADTQTLRVEGTTISGNNLTFSVQDIILTGQTRGVLATPLSRVTRIANVANTTRTLGSVYVYENTAISGGVPTDASKIGNQMTITSQSTQFSGTSVTSNNYFLMTNVYAYLQKKQAATANIILRQGQIPYIRREVHSGSVGTNRYMDHDFAPFIIIPPNSDITMTSISDSVGTDIVAGFHGFFADIRTY